MVFYMGSLENMITCVISELVTLTALYLENDYSNILCFMVSARFLQTQFFLNVFSFVTVEMT